MRLLTRGVVSRALAAACCLAPAAPFARQAAQAGEEDTQRIAAFRKLANDAYAREEVEAGNLHLRDMIESYPGRWDIASPALLAILHASRNGPEEWQEYAATRVIAGYRAGKMLRTDPALRDAWRTLITLLGYQERFLQARAEIEASRPEPPSSKTKRITRSWRPMPSRT